EEPAFKIILNESLNKKELLKNPSVVLGEAYMDKVIEIDGDLYDALVTIMDIRKKAMSDEGMLKKVFSSDYNLLEKNIFKKKDKLYEDQSHKVNHIINKLQLEDGMSLLDVGCGWGDLLIEAAKQYNISGLGITLSEEQHKAFKEKIKNEGLEDSLDVQLMDY